MQPNQVVVPLALSPTAAAVAVEGDRWAKILGAQTVMLHVGEENEATRSRFEEILREHGIEGARLEFNPGKPGATISQVAGREKATLIVAGALEKEGALAYFFGSVARQMARQAPCSVLLLKEPRVEPHEHGRWVVTVSYDDESRGMLEYVAWLAQRAQPERIDVVMEYRLSGADWALDGDLDAHNAAAHRSSFQREEEARLADLLAGSSLAGANVRAVCLRGRVGHASNEYAQLHDADLLFALAPTHLGFWDRFFQHGVEFALEYLPCALFLYRPVGT
jgi:nucleotide-binding universal stress UspA family protein